MIKLCCWALGAPGRRVAAGAAAERHRAAFKRWTKCPLPIPTSNRVSYGQSAVLTTASVLIIPARPGDGALSPAGEARLASVFSPEFVDTATVAVAQGRPGRRQTSATDRDSSHAGATNRNLADFLISGISLCVCVDT